MNEENKEEATPPALPLRRLKPVQADRPAQVSLHVCKVSYQYGVGECRQEAPHDNLHMVVELIIRVLHLLHWRAYRFS